MGTGDNNLIKRIFWTHDSDNLGELTPLREQLIKSCKKLEEEGFGFLEDSNNSGKIDRSFSVVCPDGSIYTPNMINAYLIKRRARFSSTNPEDRKMHKINMYYFGFKG